MMKHIYSFAILSVYLFLMGCTGSKELVMEKPQEGKCLIVGAVLAENLGIEERYESILENIHVVLVGKFIENGEEIEEGYRVKTDENGYFALQNVPAGSYVLKGFEIDVGFSTRLFVTSRWDGNTQIYYPGYSNVIDYTVRVWPEPHTERIIDMEINYFMLDQAMRIANKKFNVLKDKQGNLSNATYTMKNPVDYFKTKYPQWEWFKSN